MLTGNYLQNFDSFRYAINSEPVQDNVIKLNSDNNVFYFQDGSVWMFQEYRLQEPDCAGYLQTVAVNVSEIYYNGEKIRANNEKLEILNHKLEEMYEKIGDKIREQETLVMKMQVHDNFGRSLLSIRRILERKENQDKMDEQLSALKHLVYILTDSSVENMEELCADTIRHAEELGIYVLPMPFTINEETYFEDINLDAEKFYQEQAAGSDILTSQPSPEAVMGLWDKLLNEGYEEIVHIPMSSGLSGSCQSALMLAQDYDGKVQVVNNQRISVTQRQSAMDAKALAENGYHADEIREKLEEDKFNSSIYIMLDTLYYLKKGGRITPAAAALGTILRLKPVLQIQGEKLDAFAKVRGWKQAKKTMLDAMEKDLLHRFGSKKMALVKAIKSDMENRFDGITDGTGYHIAMAHTQNLAAAEAWREEVLKEFPAAEIYMDRLPLSIACHIGPGALAITVSKKMTYEH